MLTLSTRVAPGRYIQATPSGGWSWAKLPSGTLETTHSAWGQSFLLNFGPSFGIPNL